MKSKLGLGILAALLSAVSGQASLILTIDSVTAAPGSSGNFLNVRLTNTGAPVQVGGFNFTLSTTDTDITFDSTDISTTPGYIFAGDSLFGPVISTLSPGQSMDGVDLALSGSDSVGTTTVGLGRVTFDVAKGAAVGNFAVVLSLDPAKTNISDENGNSLAFTGVDGQITVTPEPGTVLMLGLGLVGMVAGRRVVGRGIRV